MPKSPWEDGEEIPLPQDWDGGVDVPLNPDGSYNGDVLGTIPAEQPRGWLEAFFPRTADAPANMGSEAAALGLDALSIPGRAYASLARPEGESYQQALGRLAPPPDALLDAPDRAGNAWTDRMAETILRDPANIPMAALAAATGGAAVAPWLARLGWAGRGLATGAGAGATMGATRQAENVAAGRPVSATEAGIDVGLGTALGLGGATAVQAVRKLPGVAGKVLTTIIDPTDKARAKGWSGEQALREVAKESPVGYIPMTLGGLRQRAAEGIARRANLRAPAIVADETAAMARGYSPRAMVDLNRVRDAGQQALADEVAAFELAGASRSAPGAASWLAAETQAAQPGFNTASVRQALNLRSGLDDFAFLPNAKGVSAAREAAAKGARREINRQLDLVAPRTRAVDAEIAPLASQMEGLGVVLDRRMNRDVLTPTDVLTGLAVQNALGGGARGGFGGVLAAAAERALRTPAPASIMFQAGTAGQRLGHALTGGVRAPVRRALSPEMLGSYLVSPPATDNARGGR